MKRPSDDIVEEARDEEVRATLRRRLAERIRSGAGIDRGEEVLLVSRGVRAAQRVEWTADRGSV